MKKRIGFTVGPALMVLAFMSAPASATTVRGESDGHHHIKLHIAKGYYITEEKLMQLCHESKDEIKQHAEGAMHHSDAAHDDHNRIVKCDGGHSLETVHDAH